MNDETTQARDHVSAPPDASGAQEHATPEEAPATERTPVDNPRPAFVRQVQNRVFPRARPPEGGSG